jgi:hypothetical protein
MDIKIGVINHPRELDIEMGDTVKKEQVLSAIESAMSGDSGVLWLTDKKGRQVGVPNSKIAYIEIGATTEERRVGFGAQ